MTFAESRSETAPDAEHIFFRSHDDLVLYARQFGSSDLPERPLVCLAGLTRNGRDFQDVAAALAAHPTHPRTVSASTTGAGATRSGIRTGRITPPIPRCWTLSRSSRFEDLRDIAILGGSIATMLAVTRPSGYRLPRAQRHRPRHRDSGACPHHGLCGRIPVPRDWEEGNETLREMFKTAVPRART